MNRQLRLAAQKVQAERLAHERALAEKLERERLARERADRERIERERAEAERLELQRLAALKAEREALKFGFEPIAKLPVVAAGATAVIPFTLANRSMNTEEFLLSALSPSGAEAAVATAQEIRSRCVLSSLSQRRCSGVRSHFRYLLILWTAPV